MLIQVLFSTIVSMDGDFSNCIWMLTPAIVCHSFPMDGKSSSSSIMSWVRVLKGEFYKVKSKVYHCKLVKFVNTVTSSVK